MRAEIKKEQKSKRKLDIHAIAASKLSGPTRGAVIWVLVRVVPTVVFSVTLERLLDTPVVAPTAEPSCWARFVYCK